MTPVKIPPEMEGDVTRIFAPQVPDAGSIDPGPRASPERAGNASAEALALLRALLPLNLSRAAEYVQANPPTADAIAVLAFIAHDLLTRIKASNSARQPRPVRKGSRTLIGLVREGNVSNYADAKDRPEFRGYIKKQLTDAISKSKRR